MAKSCSHCNAELPTDTARFCNQCGSPVSSSNTIAEKRPVPPEKKEHQPALREPVAKHTPASARVGVREERKASKEKSDVSVPKSDENEKAPDKVAWPEPLTHVAINDTASAASTPSSEADQIDFPSPAEQEKHAGQELRVKIWDQEEEEDKDEENTDALPPPNVSKSPEQEKRRPDAVVDYPTIPLVVPSREEPATVRHNHAQMATENRDVERIDTMLLQVKPQPQPPPVTPRIAHENTPPPVMPRGAQERMPPGVSEGPSSHGGHSRVSNQAQQPLPSAGYGTPPPVGQPAFASPLVPQQRPKVSRPMIIGAVLALILIIGVVGAVVFVTTPRNGVQEPWKGFNNSALGFSLRFPIDWKEQVDKEKSKVTFLDANQTVLLNVVVSNADGADVKQYARQQAETLGVSEIQDADALTFAGTTWQHIQGNLVVEGVSYRVAMYAAVHGNRLYLVTQQATSATYDENERTFFAPMRISWAFL